VDKPNKPQAPDEEAATAAAAVPSLQARSPYRPLSRRRRQEQGVEGESQVERPTTTTKFDASPTTVAAALAKAGSSPEDGTSFSWRRRGLEVAGEAGESGPAAAGDDVA
jgi:hypothetical protein